MIYLFLVGVPLAGLYGVVQAGASLVPPAALTGSWRYEGAAEARRCLGLGALERFEIEQSGRYAWLRTPDTRIEAEVSERAMRLRRSSADTLCDRGELDLELAVSEDRRALTGTLRPTERCAPCEGLVFSATRIEQEETR